MNTLANMTTFTETDRNNNGVITFYESRLAEDNTIKLLPKEHFQEEITSSAALVQFAKKVLSIETLSEENVFCFCLNTRMRCNAFFLVGSGSASTSFIDVKGLLTKSLLLNATNIILLHNHPAGSCIPSTDDRAATEDLAKACRLVGMALAGHIIVGSFVGGGEYYSFSDDRKLHDTCHVNNIV